MKVCGQIGYRTRGLWLLIQTRNRLRYKARLFRVRIWQPGRVAQSVGHLTRKSGAIEFDTRSGYILHFPFRTYFRFFLLFSRRAVFSYLRKYVHEVLVNRLGGLSLPRKSVVRLTDRPDMTLNVYRGRKTTI